MLLVNGRMVLSVDVSPERSRLSSPHSREPSAMPITGMLMSRKSIIVSGMKRKKAGENVGMIVKVKVNLFLKSSTLKERPEYGRSIL
jgi:hypothetical protein